MRPGDPRQKIGTAFGRAGEWMHYVAATWLAFTVGGVRGAALYLIAATLPGALLPRVRLGALAAPIALAVMAVTSGSASAGSLVALGALAGSGSGLGGRPAAWVAGIHGRPGLAGVAGAAAATALLGMHMVGPALATAALFMVVAFFAGEEHEAKSLRETILIPANAAMAFVVGLRVLETGLFERAVSAGLFATIWAAGVETGYRAGPRADARLILAAPFMVAAALAGIGAVTGPAMLFLYGAVALGVGLGGGVGPGAEDEEVWPPAWAPYFIATLAGALWAVSSSARFDVAMWVAGAVSLGGGFVSSAIARRVRIPEEAAAPTEPAVAPAESAVAPAEPAAAQPALFEPEPSVRVPAVSDEDDLEAAVAELAHALRRARRIRGEALAAFRAASEDPLAGSRERIEAVVDELLESLRGAAEILGLAVTSR